MGTALRALGFLVSNIKLKEIIGILKEGGGKEEEIRRVKREEGRWEEGGKEDGGRRKGGGREKGRGGKEEERRRNGEEGVNLKDFFGVIEKVKVGKENSLEELFKPFDKDKSGWIKIDEFKQVMCTLGDILQPNEIDFVMGGLTISKGGKFEIKELINILSLIG